MPIALDTETTLATEAEPVPRLVSVAIASTDLGVRLFAAHTPGLDEVVRRVLTSGLIGANVPFDVFVLLRAFHHLLPDVFDAYENDRIHDVLTREKLIDIAEGNHRRGGREYNLGGVSARRAGYPLDKNDPWRLRYGELLGLEISQWPAEARAYAEHDAAATLSTFLFQEAHPHAAVVLHDAPRQARAHLALHQQTLVGIRTDPAAVAMLDARIEYMLAERREILLANGLARVVVKKGVPHLVKTVGKAREMFEQTAIALGKPVPRTPPSKKFPTGQVQINDDEIGKLGLPDGHPLRAYQEYGSLESLRTKNITPFRASIVRCRYDELVSSGRTSASKPGKPFHGTNMQNLPRPDTLDSMGVIEL